jgi:hypothetical protein
MTIAIREMGPADISACRLLLSQLGYDLTLQEVKRRYDAIREKQDHAVFVGEQDGRLLHSCIFTNDPHSINRQK